MMAMAMMVYPAAAPPPFRCAHCGGRMANDLRGDGDMCCIACGRYRYAKPPPGQANPFNGRMTPPTPSGPIPPDLAALVEDERAAFNRKLARDSRTLAAPDTPAGRRRLQRHRKAARDAAGAVGLTPADVRRMRRLDSQDADDAAAPCTALAGDAAPPVPHWPAGTPPDARTLMDWHNDGMRIADIANRAGLSVQAAGDAIMDALIADAAPPPSGWQPPLMPAGAAFDG